MLQRTLAIIKPDAVIDKNIGPIIDIIEYHDFDIIEMQMLTMTKEEAEEFYKEHEGKDFFESQTRFMSSGPCVMMILEGEEAIEKYRKLIGPTNYEEADPFTIRAAFATDIRHNAVHGSDSVDSANFEMSLFYKFREKRRR